MDMKREIMEKDIKITCVVDKVKLEEKIKRINYLGEELKKEIETIPELFNVKTEV